MFVASVLAPLAMVAVSVFAAPVDPRFDLDHLLDMIGNGMLSKGEDLWSKGKHDFGITKTFAGDLFSDGKEHVDEAVDKAHKIWNILKQRDNIIEANVPRNQKMDERFFGIIPWLIANPG